LASVLIYGKRVQDSVSALSNTPTLFQMTGVFDDPVINNHEAFGVAAKITNVVSDSRAKLCVFQNASHSMFSWHDNPATPKPWIPALEGRTVDFLTDSQASGKFFPTSGTANDPGGTVPVCSVD
jgi:hypothetical protein